MTKINLRVRTWHNNDDDKDGGPWSYRGTTSGEVAGVEIVNDTQWGYNEYETDLEPPFYVVYCEYYTGDTFGRDYRAEIIGVFEESWEADVLVREARDFKGHGSLSNGYYIPWNGYFESLIGLHIEQVGYSRHERYR